jgi:hypothetical protein
MRTWFQGTNIKTDISRPGTICRSYGAGRALRELREGCYLICPEGFRDKSKSTVPSCGMRIFCSLQRQTDGAAGLYLAY